MKVQNIWKQLAVALFCVTVTLSGRNAGFAQEAESEAVDGVIDDSMLEADSGYADSGYSDCQACYGGSCWTADIELTFLRYHRADGVRAGTGAFEFAEFGFEIAPRVEVGTMLSDGLGFRVRWWDYNHAATGADTMSTVSVDTYTVDFEFYDTIELTCSTDVEFSAGLRYNDFEELLFDASPAVIAGTGADKRNQFTGWGGVVGLEARRTAPWGGLMYARVRGSVLMSDKRRSIDFTGTANAPTNEELLDSVQGMLEITLGVEECVETGLGLITLRSGFEWQNWYNYSSAFTGSGGGLVGGVPFGENAFAGASDVGFGGFVLGADLTY